MTLRMMGFLIAAAFCAGSAGAEAPQSSMMPKLRPVAGVSEAKPVRPMLRPEEDAPVAPVVGEVPLAPPAEGPAAETPVVEVPTAEVPVTDTSATDTPATEILATDTARAEDPPAEIPPVVEEAAEEPPLAAVAVTRLAVSPFPIPRPRVVFRTRTPEPDPEPVAAVTPVAVAPPTRVVVPTPERRPKGLLAAIFNAPNKPTKYPREGSVCGDPAIRGQALPPIPAKLRGCGQANPVRITAVDGVALSTPATINCDTATALRSWVTNVVKPTVGGHGGGVAGLRVAASYACRTRNNIPGGKISEHGRGNAIDISAILLKDGTAMTVLRGWRDKVQGPLLRAMHAKACGTFGTVLGPNSDRFHQDHFHFDRARHGYGPYCR